MLNNTGFDLWADGYDKSVGLSDENDRYPFAGYRAMMNALYQRVLAQSGRDVLDIGFGHRRFDLAALQAGLPSSMGRTFPRA